MKRLLPFVVLIILLLGAIASIPYLLRPDVQKARLTETLSKVFKHPVIVGDVAFGYFPPALQISRIAVTNNQGEAFIHIDKVSAPLNLSGLIRLQVEPDRIDLSGWKTLISRKMDGRWDARDWWPGDNGFSSAKSWKLSRVHWQQGEIRWIDPFAANSPEVVLSLVEGSWNPRPETLEAHGAFAAPFAGANLTFTAKGQFFSQPRWTGDLELTEQGNSALSQVSCSAEGCEVKVQSSRWRLASAAPLFQFLARIPRGAQDPGALALENLTFHAKASGGKAEFNQTSTISGGQSEVQGTLAHKPEGVGVHLDAAVSAVPAEALLVLMGIDLPVTGKVTGITKNLDVVLSSQTSSTLTGMGYAEVSEGHYKLPDASIKKLAKAKTTRYIQKKYPDLTSAGFPFVKASAHWQAKGGRLILDDAMFASATLKAGWVGSLDLAREGMDGFARIDFHEKDAKLKSLIPAKYLSTPAFGRLQGGWKEWYLRAVPSGKVPAAFQSKLRKAIAQK